MKDQWDDVFPTVEMSFHTDIKLRWTGMTGAPMAVKEDGLIKADELKRMLKGK